MGLRNKQTIQYKFYADTNYKKYNQYNLKQQKLSRPSTCITLQFTILYIV